MTGFGLLWLCISRDETDDHPSGAGAIPINTGRVTPGYQRKRSEPDELPQATRGIITIE